MRHVAVTAFVIAQVLGWVAVEHAIHENTAAVNRVRAEVCRGAR